MYDSICDTNSVQGQSDIEDVVKWVKERFMDGKKYESKNYRALQSENGTNVKRDIVQHSLNTVAELASTETKKRLEILEGQISNILNRLDNQDVECRASRKITQKDFQEMSAKVWLLERENKALSDENLALRLENSEVKEMFNKGVCESERRSEISQFIPKNP